MMCKQAMLSLLYECSRALTIEDIFQNKIHMIQDRGGEEYRPEEDPSVVEDGHDDRDYESLEEEEFRS